ncbi:MAG: cyclopropane-fatty-acyl-phospholipid synthase family protein [Verrucomicrobiota bacterium]
MSNSIEPISLPKAFFQEEMAETKRKSLYAKLVVGSLEKMTLGTLHLELPNGEKMTIGDGKANVVANVRIVRESFFKRCVLFGDIGFGEAYVDGDWDTNDITAVISWFILNIENAPSMSGSRSRQAGLNFLKLLNRAQHLLRPNSIKTSRKNISEHYDLGNDFYALWLDPTITYSSALFQSADQSLEQAQTAKYDALCQKLRLKFSDHVLEIGSGWGGFACHAAKNYGCKITTVTISQEQFYFAKERFVREGVSDRVRISLEDYRNISGQFDKIVSIEMIEAVGEAYLDTYFAKCNSLLRKDGLLALQMITCPDSRYDSLRKNVDWIQKHIFPGSLLLSIGRVNQSLSRTGDLFFQQLDDLGLSYARTLREWFVRFNAQLPAVRKLGFDERFIRKWNYYLCYCEAAFAARNITVVQALFTRPNNANLT